MRLRLLLLVFPVGCGSATLSSIPTQQGLAGDWTLEFRRDGSAQTAKGTLHLADTGAIVHSSIDVDFTPLLGRQMSCYDPRPTQTAISQTTEATTLVFTPGAADCGFSASGKFYGDSLVGTWSETSFTGTRTAGGFRMLRGAR